MPSLTDVFVAILPDTTQFGRQLTTQLHRIDASSSGKQIGGTLAKGLVGALAGVGVGNLLKGFVTDAAEAAKITRITENTIASMGGVANVSAGDIAKLAGSIAAKTGIDDAAIQSGQNLLLTFGNVRDELGKGNDIFTQATRLGVDMSVALGTDASGAALQLGKALNDPVKGIGALSRAGVSFTAEQKEQIKTLVASGDTLGAQKIILGELEKQFGGTAAAAADPMARLSFVVGELGESVGALLLPAVTKFADFAGGTLIPKIQGMIDGFKNGEGAAGLLAGIFDKLRDASDVLVPLTAGIVAFVVTFKVMNTTVAAYKAVQQAYAFWTYSQAAATGVFSTALHALKAAFLANPIGIVVALLVGLGVALVVAYKKSETFRDIVNGAWAAIKGSVGGVVDWFQSSVLPVLQGVWDGVSGGAVTLWHGLQAAWDGIKVGFGAAMAGFMAVYDNVIAPVFGAFKTAAQFLWDGVEIIWAGIKAGFGLAMSGFMAVYDNVVAPVFATFEAAAGLLWEGVKFFWEAIKIDFALAMAGISLVYDNVIKPLFAAFKVAAEFLWDGVQVAWDGIESGFDTAMKGVKAVYDHVIVPVFDAYKAAAELLRDGLKVIWDGVELAFDKAMGAVKAVYDNVIVPLFDAFKSAAGFLRDAAGVIWEAMRTGFDNAMRGMRAVYDNVVRPLFDTFALGVQGFRAVFQAAVDGISAVWDTLRDRMRTPIKLAFDWVNANVIDEMRGVISAITGGSVDLPNLPSLARGGPVEGPGGPRDDKVLMWGSAGEFMVNAKAAKKHRGLLEDINAGRKPERLPGDEFGGPVGDVWGTITSAAGAIKGFAADMIAKGARKAAEALLGPLKDRLFSLIGSGNVVSAVLRGGLEKLFAAVLSKGDEKDKEMAAAKKAGGIGAFPGGGTGTGLIAFARLMQAMGARVSEHPLFGGVNPVHTRGSNHYIGRAVDVNYGPGGENATEKAFFDQVVARGLPRQYGLRYIWRAPGHFNHLHADYDRGGWLQPGATGANRGRKPEAVLTDPQWTNIDRLVKALERGQGSAAGGSSFNFNVYNPVAEPTSVTTNKALQRAADLALV